MALLNVHEPSQPLLYTDRKHLVLSAKAIPEKCSERFTTLQSETVLNIHPGNQNQSGKVLKIHSGNQNQDGHQGQAYHRISVLRDLSPILPSLNVLHVHRCAYGFCQVFRTSRDLWHIFTHMESSYVRAHNAGICDFDICGICAKNLCACLTSGL